MQGRSSAVVDVVDPGAGDPQLLQFVVAAPPRGGSRLGYARAVLPAPQLSPRTTTSAHAASARARPGSAGGTLRAALASERPQAQRRGSHLQFLSKLFLSSERGNGNKNRSPPGPPARRRGGTVYGAQKAGLNTGFLMQRAPGGTPLARLAHTPPRPQKLGDACGALRLNRRCPCADIRFASL